MDGKKGFAQIYANKDADFICCGQCEGEGASNFPYFLPSYAFVDIHFNIQTGKRLYPSNPRKYVRISSRSAGNPPKTPAIAAGC
jgi:hypothetical protein